MKHQRMKNRSTPVNLQYFPSRLYHILSNMRRALNIHQRKYIACMLIAPKLFENCCAAIALLWETMAI